MAANSSQVEILGETIQNVTFMQITVSMVSILYYWINIFLFDPLHRSCYKRILSLCECANDKRTRDRSILHSANIFRITFCIDLNLSVRPSLVFFVFNLHTIWNNLIKFAKLVGFAWRRKAIATERRGGGVGEVGEYFFDQCLIMNSHSNNYKLM